MGKNNQQRRAAKARSRRRRESSGRTGAGPGYSGYRESDGYGGHGAAGRYDPTALPVLCDVVSSAAQACADGDGDIAGELAASMVGPRSPLPPGRAGQAVQLSFTAHLPVLWQHGWQPHDLSQAVRRRLGPVHHEVLVAMLAREVLAYARSTVDLRWSGQLADLGVQPEPAGGPARSGPWSPPPGVPAVAAVTAAIELLGLMFTLPPVAVQLPPPGTARSGQAPAGVSEEDERALSRVRALLAKAESTEFAEEAEALSAKAQELMARYSLHRLVAEAAQPETAAIGSRRLWLDAPYTGAKAILAQYVAQANRCQAVYAEDLGFVTVVGHERDLSAVELLVTSLLVQATRALVSPSVTSAARHSAGGTRSFRQSFLVAYAGRIGERLTGSAESAVAQVAAAQQTQVDLLPVLRADAARVEDERRRLFPALVNRSVTASNWAGRAAGRAAADQAVLEGRPAVDRAAS